MSREKKVITTTGLFFLCVVLLVGLIAKFPMILMGIMLSVAGIFCALLVISGIYFWVDENLFKDIEINPEDLDMPL